MITSLIIYCVACYVIAIGCIFLPGKRSKGEIIALLLAPITLLAVIVLTDTKQLES
jgi:hypothetical protein